MGKRRNEPIQNSHRQMPIILAETGQEFISTTQEYNSELLLIKVYQR
jgi:hypothetical protein